MTTTGYRTTNDPITGMSDAAFYGRQPAPGVDMDACRRAAVRETRRATDTIIYGSAKCGSLQLRRAVYRLAIAIGNQSTTETYLSRADLPRLGNLVSDAETADAAELDRAVAREHAHPELAGDLAEIEAALTEIRRADR